MAIAWLSLGFLAVVMMYVTRPLLNKHHVPSPALQTPSASQQRSEVLMALNELEFDYRMNKLSKEDYETLAAPYKKLAMQLMESGQKTAAEPAELDLPIGGARSEASRPTQANGPSSSQEDKLRQELEDELERALQKKIKGTDQA